MTKNHQIVWEADDGTVFTVKASCQEYERTTKVAKVVARFWKNDMEQEQLTDAIICHLEELHDIYKEGNT